MGARGTGAGAGHSSWFSLMGWSRNAADKDAEDDEAAEAERAVALVDSMERGVARETSVEFMMPLRRAAKLWRFRVLRSEDRLKYRLVSDCDTFLMQAEVCLEEQRVLFFLYDPLDPEQKLYDRNRPAFVMSYDAKGLEWHLVQEKCEHCQYKPPGLSCASHGKQQVFFVRHSVEPIGNAVTNCVDARIPGIYSNGSRIIWCPKSGKPGLSSAELDLKATERSSQIQRVISRKPVWHEAAETLILDFKGVRRDIQSSAKNFQLALQNKPDHVICQFGKLGPNAFALDFRFPLSAVQAFGFAMTTIFWK